MEPKPVMTKHPNYFVRQFEGRLNRQNYSIGSVLLLVFPLFFMLILSGSILSSPTNRAILLMNPYDLDQLQNANLQAATIQTTLTGIETSPVNLTVFYLLALYFIVTTPIMLGFQVRRLHDLNQSGWLMLLNIIPFVGYVFPLYVTFGSGTPGDNKYGPKPQARTHLKEDILRL